MLKKQLEQGKLTATGSGGGVTVPGVMPGLIMQQQMPGGMPGQPDSSGVGVHYQQAVQHSHGQPPQEQAQQQYHSQHQQEQQQQVCHVCSALPFFVSDF